MFNSSGKEIIENMREPFKSIILEIAKKSKKYNADFILFGSCARGKPTYRSDIDLFICFDDNVSREERVAVCDEFDDDIGTPPVNVMCGIRSKLENGCSMFMKTLREEGILLDF